MLFLRSATQSLLRQARGNTAMVSAVRARSVVAAPVAASSLMGRYNNSAQTPTNTYRSFADAAVSTSDDRASHWAHFPQAPPDPIIGLTEVCYAQVESMHITCAVWSVVQLCWSCLLLTPTLFTNENLNILSIPQAYLKDDFPHKVNVGVGAYRCDEGMPFVLPVVREAENEIIAEEMDHEYSGIVSIGSECVFCPFILLWRIHCWYFKIYAVSFDVLCRLAAQTLWILHWDLFMVKTLSP